MYAMMLTGIREMEIQEVSDPSIQNPKDVLIQMTNVGICGSDIHYYTTGKIGKKQVVQYPFRVGHEGAGIVLEIGSQVSQVKPGDRIAIDPSMPCWECDQCLAGRHHTCRNLKFLGNPGQAEGCLCEYIVIPESSCYVLDDRLSFNHAVISEPLAIGVYAVQQAGAIKGKDIGILGAGPIGESVLGAAKLQQPNSISVTDKIDDRLNFALNKGANWTGNPDTVDIVSAIYEDNPLGLDVVFECCGDQDAMDQAVSLLKPGGTVMIVGIPEFDRWSFDVDKLRHKEITLINIRRQVDCVRPALDLIAEGKIQVDDWVTHRYPLKKAREGFDVVADYKDGVMKTIIDIFR